MCSVLIVGCRGAGEDGVPTLLWHGTGDLFPFTVQNPKERISKEAERVMVSNI